MLAAFTTKAGHLTYLLDYSHRPCQCPVVPGSIEIQPHALVFERLQRVSPDRSLTVLLQVRHSCCHSHDLDHTCMGFYCFCFHVSVHVETVIDFVFVVAYLDTVDRHLRTSDMRYQHLPDQDLYTTSAVADHHSISHRTSSYNASNHSFLCHSNIHRHVFSSLPDALDMAISTSLVSEICLGMFEEVILVLQDVQVKREVWNCG
jgi:hypothetical protein